MLQTDLIKHIIEIFESSLNSLTTHKIREILRMQKIKMHDYEINEYLLDLQSKKIITFNNGFWFYSKQTVKTISTANDNWSPSKSKILASLPNIDFKALIDNSELSIINVGSPVSDWNLFRKLIKYYMDCVANDSGAVAFSYSDKINENFIFLNLKGKWYPESNIKWTQFFYISSPEFIRKLAKIGNDFSLVIGYPTQISNIINKDDNIKSAVVQPVFTYKVDFEFKPGVLEIICESPFPEVNLDWLESKFKTSEEQKHFLSACGMLGNNEENSFDGTKNIFPDFPDFKKLAQAARDFLKVKEPLNPDNVNDKIDFETIENGIYNKAVLMIASRSNYSRNLLNELSKIAECSDDTLEKTALKYVFKPNESIELKQDTLSDLSSSIINTTDLNAEQIKAIESLITENVTVITGPPGTGKSQVVSAAIENFRIKDRSILFASRNHKAIDAVLNKVDNSFIVRCNSKDDPSLKINFVKAIDDLLSQTYKEESVHEWEFAIKKLNDKIEQRDKYIKELNLINEYGYKISELQYYSDDLIKTIPINDQLKNLIIDEKVLDNIKIEIETLLQLFQKFNLNDDSSIFNKFLICFKSLLNIRKVNKLNFLLNNNFKENLLSINLFKFNNVRHNYDKTKILSQLISYYKLNNEIKDLINKLNKNSDKNDITEKINNIISEINKLSKETLNKDLERRQGVKEPNQRILLTNLKSAVRGLINPVIEKNIQDSINKTLENNSEQLLYHFPAWTVTNLSIGSRIPLFPGIFDLAIIDEASQCDIASVVPILFRAKRVAAVGDPKQLNHTTQISRSKDTMLRKQNNIIKLEEQRFSYPDNSFYDLMASNCNVNPIMLKDHFRCDESIAAYCNDSFYRGELRILTDSNRLKIPKSYKKGIIWNEIESKIAHGGSSGCYSTEECDKVVSIAQKILNDDNFEGSIGIVTPFRKQASRINDMIQTEISYEKRVLSKMKVDTAHGFQGDERDVIILSLCAGPNMPTGSLHFLRDTSNLLNVAVSRARASLIIVGNKKWASNSRIPHIERLTAEYKRKDDNTEKRSPWHPHQSPWEKKVFEELLQRGIRTEPQYPTRGRFLDLAYVTKDKKIDIEIDGECHRDSYGRRNIDDHIRDMILKSDDWIVLRFWVYKLREDMNKCIDKILKSIE